MRIKPSLSRRTRTSRFARRVLIALALVVLWLVVFGGYLIWRTVGDDADGKPKRDDADVVPSKGKATTGLPGFDDVGGAEADGQLSALLQRDPGALPYSEALDELLRLLRLYAAQRGVTVNATYEAPLEAAITAAGGGGDGLHQLGLAGPPGAEALRMQELEVLREIYERQQAASSAYLAARWVLDAPEVIATEQETYVERHLVPTSAEVELTPLRVIAAYYNTEGRHSLHRMAADTEKAMNDDGYATYIHRSPTFFNPSHAARRGYGQEGSIFVAVPFALSDITADMVDAIQRRALNVSRGGGAAAVGKGKVQDLDDFSGDDGFGEAAFTAARCAMTVESVFRSAHRGAAVTVGTIDVVTVAGIASQADVHVRDPKAVLVPLRAMDRAPLAATRQRRYSTVTCEPPNFRSGWEDADYGYRWKDNLRRRRVLVPLTKLARATAANPAAPQPQQQQRRLEESYAFPHVGRYAALQLYRGESYVLLLNAGAQLLPNWDLTVRLLYLRTPQRQRAVLTSRPTPGVVWRAMATALITTWDAAPYLTLSHGVAVATPPTASPGQRGAPPSAPPLDDAGRQLLAQLPADASAWLAAARADPVVALWLVTPGWLWPSVAAALAGWARVSSPDASAGAGGAEAAAVFDVFCSDVVRRVLGRGVGGDSVAAPRIPGDLRDVAVELVKDSAPSRVRVTRAGLTDSPPIAGESLSPSEVYEMLFVAERRPPMPSQPIVDMAQAASTTVAPPAQPDAAARVRGDGTVAPACGSADSTSPFYAAASKVLLKRSFELCWLSEHRNALRQTAHQLVRATTATTVLTASAGEAGAGLRKCGGGGDGTGAGAAAGASSAPFAHSTVVSRVSRCLADMRYLEPRDPTTAESEGAGEAAALSAAHVGKVEGAPSPLSAQTAAAAAGVTDGATPYVLQSVASADFLFAPAEAFFAFSAEHRLRTRPRTLAEQVRQQQSAAPLNLSNPAAATLAGASSGVPEAMKLDPTLQLLDGDLADAYVTYALWTRGWNLFGVTEAVAVGTGEPAHVPLDAQEIKKGSGEVCAVGGDAAAADAAVPPELQQARTFTLETFWTLIRTCRASGAPFGLGADADARAADTTAAAHPLRRTLSAWESFAGVQLSALQERMKAA